ncbi:MAG: ribonuclease HIII [Bacteroidetes bacterium]|nr:ribonuclease HIII [Bacteroidota bacterium]
MTPSERAEAELNTILDRCTAAGLLVEPIVHKDWNVQADVGDGSKTVKVLVYFNSKGNLTPKVQGKQTPLRDLVQMQLHGDEPLRSAFLPETVTTWIGVDESGKGDYFGPLVAGGVLVDAETLQRLRPLLLRDSKELAAERITHAAREIRTICGDRTTVVTILPERYNQLMEEASFGKNSQRMLAWMHARVIENLLEKNEGVGHAICDKFGNESVIERALMKKGRTICVHQHVRAEADPAVAAASVIARDEFVRRMAQLEQQAGCRLPLGASDESGILRAADHIVKNEGAQALRKYAKMHFKTTGKMAGRLGSGSLFQ